MSGLTIVGSGMVGTQLSGTSLLGAADMNSDRTADLLWRMRRIVTAFGDERASIAGRWPWQAPARSARTGLRGLGDVQRRRCVGPGVADRPGTWSSG